MAEITNTDTVIKKLQEFDKYISQSIDTLKILRRIKDDADNVIHSIDRKKNELIQYEQALNEFIKKVELVQKNTEAILSPILKEKQELERLDEKLTQGLAHLDANLENKIEKRIAMYGALVRKELDCLAIERKELREHAENFLQNIQKNFQTEQNKLLQSQNTFQETLNDSLRKVRIEIDARITDFLYKQNALVTNLSQQIDSYQHFTESLKTSIASHSEQIDQLEKKNTELGQIIERQSQAFITKLSQLRDGEVQQLDTEIAQMRSTLNEMLAKLNNMKFKKILGL